MSIVNQKNASMLRRYFIEYVILFLTLSVITLFYLFLNLNNKFIDFQTTVIQKNTESNLEIKQELQNFKNFR
jgi:hypothetical protein